MELLLDNHPDQIALIGNDGTVVWVNKAWKDSYNSRRGDGSVCGGQQNYLSVLDQAVNFGAPYADRVSRGLQDLIAGRSEVFEIEYPCDGDGVQRWFLMRALPVIIRETPRIMISHTDITRSKSNENILLAKQEQLDRQVTNQARLLKKSESRLRTAIETMHGGVYMFDHNFTIEIMSSNFAQTFDVPPALAREGLSFLDVLRYRAERGDFGSGDAKEDLAARLKVCRSPIPNFSEDTVGGRVIEQYRVPTSDGSVVVVFNDITERRKTEDALRRSESLLRKSQRIARLGNWHWEFSDTLWWSDEVYRLFGLAPGDMQPSYETFLGFVAPEDRSRVTQAVDAALAGEADYSIVHKIVLPGGDVRVVHEQGEVTFDDAGNPVRMDGTILDITDLQRAEENAKRAEVRVQQLLDIAPEAVITVGADMAIQLYNKSAEKIFGYAPENVIGRPLEMLMPARFHAEHRNHVRTFERSGDTARRMDKRREVVGVREDGTEFPAAASVSQLALDGEKIFTVVLQDISERKKAERTLIAAKETAEAASRAKSQFLASMSHDLRTPLNAILGFSDMMSQQFLGPLSATYVQYACNIHRSGQHLLGLVDQILDLSAIESETPRLFFENLNALEAFQECHAIIQNIALERDIRIEIAEESAQVSFIADHQAVQQILLNLLSNALKYTANGGSVRMTACHIDEGVELAVSDTGPGIADEDLERIVQPFARGQTDPYVAQDGWGLGLAISKALVEMHRGRLEIKSALGQGTTVRTFFASSLDASGQNAKPQVFGSSVPAASTAAQRR